MSEKIKKTDQEWKKILAPEEYHITREKGTEPPFTGKYNNFSKKGTYFCICCETPLFHSDHKFDAGCGWPSFFKPVMEEAITYTDDFREGRHRIEITCSRCDAHLGHVFEDGPPPTWKRYCLNSIALKFVEKE